MSFAALRLQKFDFRYDNTDHPLRHTDELPGQGLPFC